MNLRIEFHELVDVDVDLQHAWTWYEHQERGLGERNLPTHGFPYAVRYRTAMTTVSAESPSPLAVLRDTVYDSQPG